MAVAGLPVEVKDAFAALGLLRPDVIATYGDFSRTELAEVLRSVVPEASPENENEWIESLSKLIDCAVESEKTFSSAFLEFLRTPAAGLTDMVLVDVRENVPSVLRAALIPKAKKWPTRRRRLLATANPNSRREVEEKERQRWLRRLIFCIKVAELPICARTSQAQDADKAMRRVGKGRRPGTLRGHVRMIEKFQDALFDRFARRWYWNVQEVLDYVEGKADEPETRSWFIRFRSALTFFEEAGEVLPEVRK